MAIIDKPSDYFNTKLYTGNGSTQSITGVGFQPYFTWIKSRNDTNSHFLFDAVRGATKLINSNSNNAESTQADTLTSFDSDGFSLGDGTGVNGNSDTEASWNWLAGTAVSGSTTGSGTAKTYTGSVNTTSGFSIIKYTGNGTAGHTIPHHLGAAPQMVIVKALSTNDDWMVGHTAAGFNQFMILNSNVRDATGTQFNSTVPTSSVFSIGSNNNMNQNDNSFIAYSFTNIKGFSKFAGYTGNNNADGTFVYTGFKPAWIIIKRDTNNYNWYMFDSKRDPTNIGANLLSNGFKIRSTGSYQNDAEDYLYAAFAENSFVATSGTSAIPVTAR